MDIYLVKRITDEVLVSILKHKNKDKYSFINITKQHICPCEFDSIDDALKDMDELKEKGIITSYYKINLDE